MGLVHNTWRSVQSAYLRITFSRVSLAFFAFSTIFCIVQGVIQSLLINTDLGANNLVDAILHEAEVPMTNVVWYTEHGNHTTMKICSQIPRTMSYDSCITVYDTSNTTLVNVDWAAPAGFRRADAPMTDSMFLTIPKGTANAGTTLQAAKNATGAITGVIMLAKDGDAFLTEQCTRVLLFPHEFICNSEREEIVLLIGQFWFFGISICALIFDSTPHILALICMHFLETAWSAFTIWRTRNMQRGFEALLMGQSSPCLVNIFPHYFNTRLSFQIPDLVLNVVGLLCSLYLGRSLIKTYNVQTFKRVGPPEKVVRIYRLFLTLAVALHLALFLTIAAMGLWANQLLSGPISAISTHTSIYDTLLIFTIVTLAPWCYMGSFAVRRENRWWMALFLAICFIYIASWSIMFYSQVYRWTWVQWPFFASMTVASFIILIIAGIFAVICLLNFDRGLAHYLHVEGVLAQSDFQPGMFSSNSDLENKTALGLRYKLSLKSTKSADTVDIDLSSPAGRSLAIKKDSNWSFDGVDGPDTKRPAIYMVELDSERSFKALPSHLDLR
ncbi:hypothetical protein EUX98_g4895 [Antrodiella citrinella]|uniref:Uncharacterized protein n=1 Tax=Antrodiella citrinella TaxID=2447956 RepID=A0A4S4MSX0_9APHY|nr:hypothetical protein EUX98_g4895 [Antrodiella citrinella]